MLWSAVEFSHTVIRAFCADATVAFDATVGNGGDTEFLLKLLSGNGIVFGTEVQRTAIDVAMGLLQQQPFRNYTLFHRSCTEVLDCMQELGVDTLDIVMMNCGYLPGGNKSITTNAKDTVLTIEQCCNVLSVGGVMSVVVYYGHDEGKREVEAVGEFVQKLSPKRFQSCSYTSENMTNSPKCFIIQRLR